MGSAGVAVPQEVAGRGNRGGRVCGTWLKEEPASWVEQDRHGASRCPGGRRDGAAGLRSAAPGNGSMAVADGGGTASHRESGEPAGGRGWPHIQARAQ